MNFWKPDRDSSALTGALCEYVQSPTKSNDTLDYRSEGSTSGTSTPQLLETSHIIVIEDSEKPEEVSSNVEAKSLEEVDTDEGPPVNIDQDKLNSFKKREIKCRNIRKTNNSRQRTVSPPQRPKSVEKSSKNKYPNNWAEYKESGLNVQKHINLKSKLSKTLKETKFEFQKFFNFETPSPPIEAFKYHSKNLAVWIDFPFLRCTATQPPIIYSDKQPGHLTRQQLFAMIPKNRQQMIEKLMKSSKCQVDCKPLTERKWYSKTWPKIDKIETKSLENSVGLSFLQTYSDEENVVSQTPPVKEEKEEGEVTDDDSHNQSFNSVVEEVKEIKKSKEELPKNNKEEVQKSKDELEKVSESLVKTDNEVPTEKRKKRKKVKANKVSRKVKSKKKKKTKKKTSQSDDDKKRKLKKTRKNSKDKSSSKQKKKSATKNDSKKKKKTKPVEAKPPKLEIHPDYQDDIQFFADRLDAERQLKGKTKHKTKLNISLEEFNLDDSEEITSTEKKEEIKVDLLKMNEEYLREQKRKNSKERSCSKEKSNKHPKKEVDEVLENIKQEQNSWESEEEVIIDDQLIGTPIAKPLDLEMPLNIKTYCRRDIENHCFDIPTTPKKGRWDIQTSTPTKKIEVLEDEYEEFMKAVTDTVVADSSLEEIKPVPAPKTIQNPLIKNITIRSSTPNTVTLGEQESMLIPTQDASLGQGDIVNTSTPLNNEDIVNLSMPVIDKNLSMPVIDKNLPIIPPVDNVATSENLSVSNVVTTSEENKIVVPIEPVVNVAKDITISSAIDNVPEIRNNTTNEAIMNLSIAEKNVHERKITFANEDFPINQKSNNIDKGMMNFTKNIPVMINHCTDKDVFNIPLDKDIDNIESEWKETFKPIMLPIKNLLGSSKLNLEDFDGHTETFETFIEENDNKHREASPKRTKKESIKKPKELTSKKQTRQNSPKRRREISPIRRRKDRKRSPIKRHSSPRSRRRLSPRRRRSPSPRKKSKYSPSRDKKPRRLSPLKHLPDSTISDDQLRQKPHEDSPQRLPLDIRINQVLGLEAQPLPSPEQFYQYNNFANVPIRPQPQQSNYKQVGNMLQIVPVEQELPQQQAFQHPPFASTPRSQIRQIGNMLEIVPTEMVPVEAHPPQVEIDNLTKKKSIVQIKTEKVDEDLWCSSNEVDSNKLSAEAAMLQKEAERLTERENRRIEREKRKKEKERRRKEREKLRQIKLKAKNEKMIKRALDLEIDQMLQEPTQDNPVDLMNHYTDFKGKSILVNKLSSLDFDKSNKAVKFADGIRPGEGTSPSAGEELYSPPPPILPKEKRFKKTLFGKHKGKKKAKVIKKQPIVESDSDDGQPPPSPPPGSPPPHIFPPRIKVKPVNNVPAALLASIIQTAQQQQFNQYRPTINMMMAPPPPLGQSPSLPPVSPQMHPSMAVPPPPLPPQAGHSRHF
ncbi:unnamed protein product [Ceutorhynchus assimilis]|uniref:Uncharacterized protein n=1 Tax=Ceutorhynchus assimilis TaxID=467358 RepID=A0A9N9MYJ3_9CUCU|nr:unnamed protein product [Ceutorhynchus assimilis]